ncbi:MAG: DinB family protein [Phycisphaerales bacterium]
MRDLPGDWIRSNYGAHTFSPYDIVGHLLHGERTDWTRRARIILDHGEREPFEPFDRYAMYELSRGKSLDDLLAEFAEERRQNLAKVRSWALGRAELDRRGRHPDPSFPSVTLGQLLAAWVVHDLHHLGQVAKCMARQYTEAVGPWRSYLSILNTPLDGG